MRETVYLLKYLQYRVKPVIALVKFLEERAN